MARAARCATSSFCRGASRAGLMSRGITWVQGTWGFPRPVRCKHGQRALDFWEATTPSQGAGARRAQQSEFCLPLAFWLCWCEREAPQATGGACGARSGGPESCVGVRCLKPVGACWRVFRAHVTSDWEGGPWVSGDRWAVGLGMRFKTAGLNPQDLDPAAAARAVPALNCRWQALVHPCRGHRSQLAPACLLAHPLFAAWYAVALCPCCVTMCSWHTHDRSWAWKAQ